MPSQHALLSPSGAKRWMTCPPSARLEEKIIAVTGEKTSSFAEEGTKAHSLAELKLRKFNGEINDYNFSKQRKALGDIPKDMEEATDYYVAVIEEKLFSARKVSEDAKLFIETRVDVSRWAPKCFGTADAIVVSDGLLEVCDLKYGKGVPIFAEENPQARLYGLGAMYADGVQDFLFKNVRNTIIQPRLDTITDETLSCEDLLKWAEEEVMPAAELAWKGDGEFKPGDHCRFCAAKAVCSARAKEAMTIFDTGFKTPDTIDASMIPRLLEVIPVAKAWMADLEAYALATALAGEHLNGWKLVRGRRPNRTWTDEEATVQQLLRSGYERENFTETKLKSVGAVEKLLGKSAFKALLGNYTQQGEGKLELAPETDKRVEFNSAEAAFNDLSD